jgi:hypothetical protein
MRELRHPMTGAVYGIDGDLVRVERDGVAGWFDGAGRWVRGALRIADPELCRWLVSREVVPSASATRPPVRDVVREAS